LHLIKIMNNFVTIKEYLESIRIEYDDSLVRRIEKYLNEKLANLGQTSVGIKIENTYMLRYLKTRQTAKYINKIISNHESINF
jgi:hypothetical protein